MSTTLPRINFNDVRPKLVLAAGLSLSNAIILLCTRIHTRWNSSFKLEDYILFLSMCLGIGYTILIFWAIAGGLGHHITGLPVDQTHKLHQSVIGANLLAWVTEGMATSSYAVFLASLSLQRTYQHLINSANWAIGIWLVAALVVGCVLTATDTDPYAASIAFGVTLAAIYFALTSTVVWMLWGISTRLRRKITAILWFSWGICTAAVLIARVTVLPSAFFEGDWTFDRIGSLIFLTVEVQVCVCNATYITLLKFLKDSSTGSTTRITNSSNSRRTNAFSMSNRFARGRLHDGSDLVSYAAECTRTASEDVSSSSLNSRSIMVESSVTVMRE